MEKISKYPSLLFLFLMSVCIVIIYSNTFQVPFILDDSNQIVERPELHLHSLSAKNILNTFFIDRGSGKKLFRPISCFSLALNYYVGRFNVTGYHLFNLAVHILTGIFLFKTLVLLLGFNHQQFQRNEIKNIAATATFLWAIHPIQIQAVTYIVQRMASLSAFFYIIGIWAYLKFRSASQDNNRKHFLIFSLFIFFCSFLTKENAVLFPVALVLIEFFFLDGVAVIRSHPVRIFSVLAILAAVFIVFSFCTMSPDKILSSYAYRPFTLEQRLLTEPRILLFYLFQLFYPIPGQFSITHSFLLSNSLFNPLSTFAAIAAITLIVIFSIVTCRRYPFIGFPLLFYFSHHLVESTFLSLELVFEHRNYLPSFFIFLPLSYGMCKLMTQYQKQNKLISSLLFLFLFCLFFLVGFSTYQRNADWKSHKSLWESSIKSSPDLIRPYAQLGWHYTRESSKNLEKARHYFHTGLTKKASYNLFEKAMLWTGLSVTYEKSNNIEKSINATLNYLSMLNTQTRDTPELLELKATRNLISSGHFYLANQYFLLKKPEKALYHINTAIKIMNNDIPDFLNTKSKILITTGQYDQALKILQISLKKNHENWNTCLLVGKALESLTYYNQSFWFYRRALHLIKSQKTKYPYIYLYLAENRFLMGDNAAGDNYLDLFIRYNSLEKSIFLINNYEDRSLKSLPFSHSTTVLAALKKRIKKNTRLQ